MKDNVSKFSTPRYVEIDRCAGTFATAKACAMVLPHRGSIECEIDTDFYNQPYISVLGTFSMQFFNEDSDITKLEEVLEATKLFVEAMDGTAARTRRMILEAPSRLPPTP